MEVTGYIQEPAAPPPGKEPPIPIVGFFPHGPMCYAVKS